MLFLKGERSEWDESSILSALNLLLILRSWMCALLERTWQPKEVSAIFIMFRSDRNLDKFRFIIQNIRRKLKVCCEMKTTIKHLWVSKPFYKTNERTNVKSSSVERLLVKELFLKKNSHQNWIYVSRRHCLDEVS